MKVLKYNQIYLTWLGLLSDDLDKPTNDFFKSIGSYLMLFGFAGPMLTCSGAYAYKHRDSLLLSLRAVLIFFAGLQCAGSHIYLAIKMKTAKVLHLELQKVVNSSEKTSAFAIYENIESECQRKTWSVASFMVNSSNGIWASVILYSAFCMLNGNYNTATWLQPYNLVVPFETESIVGWFIFYLVQCYLGTVYSLSKSSVTSYFMSCCLYVTALCQHFALKVDEVKKINENRLKMKGSEFRKANIEVKIKMKELVIHHLNTLKIFGTIADLNSGVIFAQLPCNVFFFAAALYQTEHTVSNFNMLILYDILCVIVSLIWPFIMCYSATQATYAMSHIAEVIYNDSNWPNLPLDVRGHIALIMARSQGTLYFTGFTIVRCTLETFLRLNNSACSYYIMFRNISQR